MPWAERINLDGHRCSDGTSGTTILCVSRQPAVYVIRGNRCADRIRNSVCQEQIRTIAIRSRQYICPTVTVHVTPTRYGLAQTIVGCP